MEWLGIVSNRRCSCGLPSFTLHERHELLVRTLEDDVLFFKSRICFLLGDFGRW